MTPQSSFIVAAPILCDRKAELHRLLSTMNDLPGMARPDNPLVPFGRFETLHFARFVILDDATLGDLSVYGPDAEFRDAPVYLAFLGECDGSAAAMLAALAERAADGLRTIFAHCVGFDPNSNLLQWLRQHSVRPAASYVNWIGRTVRQIKEEARLHLALADHLAAYLSDDASADRARLEPQRIRAALVRAVAETGPRLTPPAPTPIGWRIRQVLYGLAAAGAVLIVALPALVLSARAALSVYVAVVFVLAAAAAAFLVCLRRHETRDPAVGCGTLAQPPDRLEAILLRLRLRVALEAPVAHDPDDRVVEVPVRDAPPARAEVPPAPGAVHCLGVGRRQHPRILAADLAASRTSSPQLPRRTRKRRERGQNQAGSRMPKKDRKAPPFLALRQGLRLAQHEPVVLELPA